MSKDFKVTSYNEPFPYLYLENVYSEDDLNHIWKDLDVYQDSFEHFYKHPRETGSAGHTDQPNALAKQNRGFFLHDVYHHPHHSAISRCSEKIYYKELLNVEGNKYFEDCQFNEISILLSQYGPNDYYLPHRDATIATGCLWLYKEPKKFEGGVFRFTDYDLEIECKNNCMVVFPGPYKHEVTEIEMDDNDFADGYGRYTISFFMNVRLPF